MAVILTFTLVLVLVLALTITITSIFYLTIIYSGSCYIRHIITASSPSLPALDCCCYYRHHRGGDFGLSSYLGIFFTMHVMPSY